MAQKNGAAKSTKKGSKKRKETIDKPLDQKAEGRSLFMYGHHSQAQIAALLGVTENTVSRWKKEGNWEEVRAARISGRDESERLILDQIFKINDDAAKAGRALEYKETQSVLLLAKALSHVKVSTNLAAKVETGISFTTWVRDNHPEDVRRVAELWDQFLTAQFQHK